MSITTKFIPHSLIGIVSVLPALLVMPAVADVTPVTEHLVVTDAESSTQTDVSWTGFTSAGDGGAIENYGTLVLNNVVLSGNDGRYGGAVENYGSDATLTLNNVTLSGNTAASSGAIDSDGGAILNVNAGTKFIGNSAERYGGAIGAWNGEVTIEGTQGNKVIFSNNTSLLDGGAIYNSDVLDINYAEFNSNKSLSSADEDGWGGAIANGGVLSIDNTIFDGNSAKFAGAIIDYLDSEGGVSVEGSIQNTVFRNNTAEEIGAVGLYTKFAISRFDHVDFLSNKATLAGADSDGSGAIFAGAQSRVIISDSTFDSNESAARAGAIGTRGFLLGNNKDAKLDITGTTTFTNNKAATNGGAIDNFFYNDAADDGYVNVSGATFTSNSAANGGAVYNHIGHIGDNLRTTGRQTAESAESDIQVGSMYFTGTTFTGNTATAAGGAIYNEGIVTLAGTNTFSGNTAAGNVNDIYNIGTLNIASGTTTIDGGIAGTGALTIANGATLNLGTASIVQNTITLDGIVNADLKSANEFAFLDAATFTDTTTGKLNLTLKGVGEYNVFKNAVFANTNIADSSVFAYDWNDAGDTITVSTKSASEIIEAIDDVKAESVNAVVAMANAKDETAQQIGNALAAALADGDTELVEHEVKKLAPEEKPVTHSVASSVQNQVLTLTANRMTGGVAAGRAGGDEINADYGFWAQGLYNKSRFLGEFDGQSRGVAVGFDALINKMYTLGIGYAFSNSDIDMSGDGGSFDIDSHTVFVYGQYKPSQWFINATLSNTVSKYTEKAVVMGTPTETEYDVNSFGIQAMTGYDFASGITPMVGARYLHVSTDGHERLLGYVDDSKSSFLSAVAGLKYAFDIQDTGSVRWTPELRALATYDVIADKNGATVYIPGGSIYHVAGDRMSRGGGELGMGLTAEWRGLELSLNYDLQLREDYLSHTGMVKLRCEF